MTIYHTVVVFSLLSIFWGCLVCTGRSANYARLDLGQDRARWRVAAMSGPEPGRGYTDGVVWGLGGGLAYCGFRVP